MIRNCRNAIQSQSAVSHCKCLCLVSVVLCSVIVGTLTKVSLSNFVFKKKRDCSGSGCNLDSIAKKKNQLISPGHARPTARPLSRKHRTLLRYSRICDDIFMIVIEQTKPTEFPRILRYAPYCWGAWPTSRDHFGSVGICHKRIRLCSDNDRTFHIIQDSNSNFFSF